LILTHAFSSSSQLPILAATRGAAPKIAKASHLWISALALNYPTNNPREETV
jgi:hypothetical protein